MRALLVLLGLLLGSSVVLAGCGAGDEDGEPRDPSVHTQADVDFTTEMIKHHAEALVMVDLTVGRDDLDPELVALASGIRETQAPEIEQLSDWLQQWDEPIPETVRDHVNAGHGDDDHGSDGFEDLEQAKGDDFRRLWLERMIEHHEGAVEMAEQELEDGSFGDTRELAGTIAETQATEIETMQQLLG